MLRSLRSLYVMRTAVFVAALAAPVAAQSAGRPLAIEDYYRVKTVGNPNMSPDGRWVAFNVATRVESTNGTTSEVWAVPTDGSSDAKRLSDDGANASVVAWVGSGHVRLTSNGKETVASVTPDATTPAIVSPAGEPAPPRGGRGGRGQSARILPSPNGAFVASVQDTPPPTREKIYESDFVKRHEERFKGVEFDWMEFPARRRAVPASESRRSRRESVAGDLPAVRGRRGAASTDASRPSPGGRELESRGYHAGVHG